jgi:hypothetical protein
MNKQSADEFSEDELKDIFNGDIKQEAKRVEKAVKQLKIRSAEDLTSWQLIKALLSRHKHNLIFIGFLIELGIIIWLSVK